MKKEKTILIFILILTIIFGSKTVRAESRQEEIKWKDNGNLTYTSTDGRTIQIGDYVNYNCSEGVDINEEVEGKTIYTSKKEQNGEKDQIFKTSTAKDAKWQVIGVDEDGCLKLISSKIIASANQEYFPLKGKNGYANGIKELDKISSIYGQGKYAKSARVVKIEDINTVTGFDMSKIDYTGFEIERPENKVTYTKNVEDGYIHYIGTETPLTDTVSKRTKMTYWTGTEWKELQSGESVTVSMSNSYGYYPQTLTEDESKEICINGKTDKASIAAYNLLFGENLDAENLKGGFWIGTQEVYLGDGYIVYGMKGSGGSYVGEFDLFFSNVDEEEINSAGVRPVVTLKLTTTIENGDGTEENPWTLNETKVIEEKNAPNNSGEENNSENKDNTVISQILPKTGKKEIMLIAIGGLGILSIIILKKYKKMKDVK